MIYTQSFEVEGKNFNIEFGRVAKQANGSCMLSMGDTVILATATMSNEPREGIDFLPLVCDYEERKYSIGAIPGGFAKRGGRPSEKAVLTSRLIDRPIRPLFPKGLRNEVQVIAMPMAVDSENLPDALAICASGLALAISDIPFRAPVAGVRIGRIDGKFIPFPNSEELKASDLDLIVAGHKDAISMVEAGSNEVSEADMVEALTFAHKIIKQICQEFEKIAEKSGKKKKEVKLFVVPEELVKTIEKECTATIDETLSSPDKLARESALSDLNKELVAKFTPKYADNADLLPYLAEAIDKVVKSRVRHLIINEDKRPDGRSLTDIRKLDIATNLLPKVHGSGLFTRGQTQVLTVCTLGMPSDAQKIDGLHEEENKRYMHYYNFPPYSVGEARPLRGPGRREVGHGALAERALLPVLPLDRDDFPYTLQLTSEVLESNGSSSMASVCGSTLSLMDSGVPIKAPVAGIAMGLMSDGKVYKVLTDIQGMEDFCGDMDFKVAGTKEGITALQLDTKLDGIPQEVLTQALQQAKDARLFILNAIEKEIPAPRAELSPRAPRMITVQVNPDKIGALIGPGGATIRKIVADTGAQIDVEQDGRVLIGAANGEQADAAKSMIQALTMVPKEGDKFSGKVTRILGKGAMIEIVPGKEGMLPVEQITNGKHERIERYLNIGDMIEVTISKVDNMGRLNLSAKLKPGSSEPKVASESEPSEKPRERNNRNRRDKGRKPSSDAPQKKVAESSPEVENPENKNPEKDYQPVGVDFGAEINARFRPRR